MKQILAWILIALMSVTPLLAFGDDEDTSPSISSEETKTMEPTATVTVAPTAEPTAVQTTVPTVEITPTVTSTPTSDPTKEVSTTEPTAEPTIAPTTAPTPAPTAEPTTEPTMEPTVEPTAEPTATPVPTIGEALSIDTVTVYDGMSKSYGQGYVPTVSNNVATIILPLKGNTLGQKIRVTPELSTDGPYVYGNYQFDVSKGTATVADGTTHEVFLIRLDLPLNATRYNGTYAIPFTVDYVAPDGSQAQQTFNVQLTITDGKNRSTGGGGGTPTVKKPVLLIESCSMLPREAAGGETVKVRLTIQNLGNYEAKNIRVSLIPESGILQIKGDLNAQFFEALAVKKELETGFDLYVVPGALEGTAQFHVQVEYEDKYGGSYTETGKFEFAITQSKVEITNYTYNEVMNGGEDFSITLTVQNTGSRDADHIAIQFVAEDDSIRNKDTRDTQTITRLKKGETASVTFHLHTLPSASEGKHTLRFNCVYQDANSGGNYSETIEYPLTVLQKAAIGYDEVRLPESMTSGESFSQPICVYNTGFTPIYNVRCTLNCDGLISSSAFLGNLAPQESADKVITVFVTTLSGSQKYGDTYGMIEITYEDSEGQQYVESMQVKISVKEPQKQTDEEKEREKQKVEEQQTLSQWWVSVLIGIAAISLLIAVIVISKFMRMLKMK